LPHGALFNTGLRHIYSMEYNKRDALKILNNPRSANIAKEK